MDSTLDQLRATLLNRLGTADGSVDAERKAIDDIFEQLNTKKNARGKPTPPSASIPQPTAAEPTAVTREFAVKLRLQQSEAKLAAVKLAALKLAAAKLAAAKPAAATERQVKIVQRAEEIAKARKPAANGGFKLSEPAPAPPPPLSYLRQRAGYAGDPKERRVKIVKRAEEIAKARRDRSEL